jgi:hypothetical protein
MKLHLEPTCAASLMDGTLELQSRWHFQVVAVAHTATPPATPPSLAL